MLHNNNYPHDVVVRSFALALLVLRDELPTGIGASPPMLWGDGGRGKTSLVKSIATKVNVPYYIIRCPDEEPANQAGYPVPDMSTGTVRRMPSHMCHDVKANNGNFIVFFDELADAPRATQVSFHAPIIDGEWGEVKLPPHMRAAASNPPEISTTGGTISNTVAKRFVHFWYDPSEDNFVKAMMTPGVGGSWPEPDVPNLPKDWTNELPTAQSLVAQFLKAKPGNLTLSKQERESQIEWKPTPCERSWTTAIVHYAACVAANEPGLMHCMIAGSVGQGRANEFLTWVRNLDLPDPEDILFNCDSYTIPARTDQILAMASSVVECVVRNNNADRWTRGWSVLKRLLDNGRGDYASLVAPKLAQNMPPKAKLPAAAASFVPLLQDAGLLSN